MPVTAKYPTFEVGTVLTAAGACTAISLGLWPWLAPPPQLLAQGLSAAWGLWCVAQWHRAHTRWWAWHYGTTWQVSLDALPLPTDGLMFGQGFRLQATQTQLLE